MQGAVESLLERSSYVQLADGSIFPIDQNCRQLLLSRLLDMSSKGLRCLGLAFKDDLGDLSDYYTENHPAHKKLLDPSCYSSIESGLIFVGVVGIRVSTSSHAVLVYILVTNRLAYLSSSYCRILLVKKFIKQLRIAEKQELE